MGRLHRLLDYCFQALCQSVQVNFIAQVGTEGFECADCIVLASVKAPVNSVLNAMTQWLEERSNQQRGANDYQWGVQDLSGQPVHERLQTNDTTEVDYGQQYRQRTIDKRAMDDDINIPEASA